MTKCPATMCPLFAAEGSPWTGDKDAACPQREPGRRRRDGCGWYTCGKGCQGAIAAVEQVVCASIGRPVPQIGIQAKRQTVTAPKTYDCPRAADCQWQVEAGEGLCPPRLALSRGLDPRVVAW